MSNKLFGFHAPLRPIGQLVGFGVAPGDPGEPEKFFAFTTSKGVSRVYEYGTSQEDVRTLGNLVRTGEVVDLVYGRRVRFQSISSVELSVDGRTIEDSRRV